jgi:hypothetical protein
MKKKPFFFLSILLCSVLTLLSDCGAQKKDKSDDDGDEEDIEVSDRDEKDIEAAYKKLSEGIKDVNAQCPISLGSLGEMTSITFEDGVLLFSYDIEEDYFSVATLAQDRQAMKDNMKTMLSNPQGEVRRLMEMVIDADCKLKTTMYGKTSGSVASATFKSDELEKLLNAEVTPHEKLTIAIASTQAQLPLKIDEGMMITELKQVGDDVVYVVEMDESMYDISMVRENKSMVKGTIENNIKNMGPVEREFIKLVVNDDKNLVYRYTVNSRHVDVKITNAELIEQL